MTVSYTLRLLCVLTIVSGVTFASSQMILALAARRILRRLEALNARGRERILYSLQIAPALLALFIAGTICLPAYLHGETNLESEKISGVCLSIAAVEAIFFSAALLRGLRITVRTLLFARACSRSGQPLQHIAGIPVFIVPDPGPPLRLIGFLRPLILVSPSLTGGMRALAPGAFDLALSHERSHAAHRDNWKLLTLSLLPRFDRFLPGGNQLSRAWQHAADWAADDDAVQGDPARSLLLAETLVTAARTANATSAGAAPYICTALTSVDGALALRIGRLIHPRSGERPTKGFFPLFVFVAITIFAAAAACAWSPWIYALSERLLHLGTV